MVSELSRIKNNGNGKQANYLLFVPAYSRVNPLLQALRRSQELRYTCGSGGSALRFTREWPENSIPTSLKKQRQPRRRL